MEKLVEKAIKKVTSLPEDEKEAFAGFILAELESERKWDELISKSKPELKGLADDALKEDEAGNTEGLNFDNR